MNEVGDLAANNKLTSVEVELKNKQEEINGLKQIEEMFAKCNEELEMMQQKHWNSWNSLSEPDTRKKQLYDQLKVLKLQEHELKEHEKLNKREERKVGCEEEMIRSILIGIMKVRFF
nr:factor of DNA methylation 4-like [Ipomoea batatas]